MDLVMEALGRLSLGIERTSPGGLIINININQTALGQAAEPGGPEIPAPTLVPAATSAESEDGAGASWSFREARALEAGAAAGRRLSGSRAQVVQPATQLQSRFYVLVRDNSGTIHKPPTTFRSWASIKMLVASNVQGKPLHDDAVFQGFPSQREAEAFVRGVAPFL